MLKLLFNNNIAIVCHSHNIIYLKDISGYKFLSIIHIPFANFIRGVKFSNFNAIW